MRWAGWEVRVYVGTFMSSLDMNGASVSVLRLTPQLAALLDQPTACPAWVPAGIRDQTPTAVPAASPAPGASREVYRRPEKLSAEA